FTFDTGAGSALVDFSATLYSLNGGCPVVRNYDAIDAAGTAVRTHRYRNPVNAALGAGAIVMNRNDAGAYNTIQQTHPWFDIRDNAGTPAATPPELTLLEQILGAALPAPCLHSPNPATGTGDDPDVDALPRQPVLHQNVPNPFNPMTEIRFDLSQSGRVSLRIYDVAGRLVRTLVDKDMSAGRNHTMVWNGLDDQNNKVASGVYFYRLNAVDKLLTKKMVVMK
ncbi:MAG TPA: FlgD immunoglobulin-like domain containing protein, partial [Candidatus Krumholzibacteria bacterium]|nr:FlgD immunoglobulin-like domain containing protein [Candidatus Krumholzibacteria bacterium]